MASLIAHHLQPKPTALLCITGIPTFKHPFFSSSVQLTPEPIKDEQVENFVNAPVEVGITPPWDPTTFEVTKLLDSGEKNTEFVHPRRPSKQEDEGAGSGLQRVELYDYYLHRNLYPIMLDTVDPGFLDSSKLGDWPATIFIQGGEDCDVSVDVSKSTAEALGGKGRMFLAEGEGHLFEACSYLEDPGKGISILKEAITALDEVIGSR
jgi:hypothetical protein